jgi:hypothetical protein
VVEVTSDVLGVEQKFKSVIGHDGQLELIESTTPFKREFNAVGITAMFEAVETEGSILAALHGEKDGEIVKFGHVIGRSGKITEEPWHDCVSRSFGPF